MTLLQAIQRLWNRTTSPANPQRDRIYIPTLHAGVNVNEDTALQFSAVFRAVSYISSQLAMMPWRVMREGNSRRELLNNHPVDRLLHKRPNPETSAFSFRETLISHALTWGNGYAEIERDRASRPIALWILSPDRVDVRRGEDGTIEYYVMGETGPQTVINAANMYHLHGLGFDGLTGYSVINMARRAIALGIGAEKTGASLFENGLLTNLVIEHPETFSDGAYKNFKESLTAYLKGSNRAGKPLIVEEGIKTKNLTMPMDDAQFLETRQFQVEDIARWYGLPPHKLQSLNKATFSNIEQQSIEVVVDALQPWAVRLEQEADYKLFNQRGNFYTKINMNSLLRGDMAARSQFYREMWNLGVFSVNEIRELEDMNPVEYGDKRFVQLNMTTLEKAGEEPALTAPAPEPEDDEDEEVGEIADKIVRREAFRLTDACKRYNGDRAGFVKWLGKFLDEHRNYCVNKYAPLGIEAYETIAARTPSVRLRMLICFDTGTQYSEQQARDELVSALARKTA